MIIDLIFILLLISPLIIKKIYIKLKQIEKWHSIPDAGYQGGSMSLLDWIGYVFSFN